MKVSPAALALILLLPATARATPTFPGVIAGHLELGAPPPCTLCHVGPPARGTVITPFGTTMRSRGASAYDEASVRLAVDALSAEKKDSDGDGLDDIEELRMGADPNTALGEDVIVPTYGCSTSGPGARVPSLAFTSLLAVLIAVSWRRRTGSSPRSRARG